jgi:hypothetical protein
MRAFTDSSASHCGDESIYARTCSEWSDVTSAEQFSVYRRIPVERRDKKRSNRLISVFKPFTCLSCLRRLHRSARTRDAETKLLSSCGLQNGRSLLVGCACVHRLPEASDRLTVSTPSASQYTGQCDDPGSGRETTTRHAGDPPCLVSSAPAARQSRPAVNRCPELARRLSKRRVRHLIRFVDR